MPLDLNSLTPAPNPWFSEEIRYEGNGAAEFENPRGTFEGPSSVAVDRFGNATVDIKVEKVKSEQELEIGPMQLLFRTQPVREAGHVEWGLGGDHNPCRAVTVRTPEGTFHADDKILCTRSNCHLDGTVEKVTFAPLRAMYSVAGAQVPKYWVLPITNFLSDFFDRHPNLDRHPLRVYQTPSVPIDLSERDLFVAQLKANEKNQLIVFDFRESMAFIEPLPAYEDRKPHLEQGKERALLTALMIGDAPPSTLDWTGLEEWFPFEVLDILSLASGTEVGAPWIEFRAANGKLVSRFHARRGKLSYIRGHRSIREDIHRGTGLLLSCSLKSPEFGKSYLHVAIKHTVRGGSHEGVALEDRLNHVARALDCIANHLHLSSMQLLNHLSPNLREEVEDALQASAETIKRASRGAAAGGSHEEAKVLDRIAARIVSNTTSVGDFGQAVIALLDHFGLPDGRIVDAHYQRNPRPDKQTWAQTLSRYRGTVMHRSYFDFRGSTLEVEDILRILEHLHDILLRIIFKILAYEGKYQPTVCRYVSDSKVNWVESGTSAASLGYSDS